MITWLLVIVCYYVFNAVKNESLSANRKAAWAIALMLCCFFALPVYWYLHIWRAHTRGAPSS